MIEDTKDAAQEVFKELGSGHTEVVYEAALEIELIERGYNSIRRQVPCPIYYKGYLVGTGFIDILVENFLVVEIKSINKITNKDHTQLRKYLLGTGMSNGLLLNFNPSHEEVETWPVR